MGGLLYAHNEQAYHAALGMLSETGRAAIIHPTGTGKSFIGFQLCTDFPQQQIYWLSPSEYIFQTQLENWKAVGGEPFNNITFLTYAKLMLLAEHEIGEIQPAYIVLDEFHRCGAEKWGRGVQRLLAQYPKAKVLGLSATNIRYLDNQRDMAEELFDGCIASEMTLGEAIVRGILNPPRYILTAFSLQNSLKQYESRIKHIKSRPVQDRAEKLMDLLRRALEQADGLDVIFQKYITNCSGKYIVFCANANHMDEMISHVPEWFGGIDPEPHVYRAYSDDPATNRAFIHFKKDDSAHLKLLFCIDMLNEGVHVENISGVILFRPTVSPIIYKQQIGRALSASKANEPVILDVVNNVENLYSIGTLKQEVQDASLYFHTYGDFGQVVNERFQVIDEVRDCRQLFAELENTLTASWELMYEHAKTYYNEHGNLEVPRRYKTVEGYSLGNWLLTQRRVRDGRQYGALSAERIRRLDEIGMVWDDRCTVSWNRYYAALCQYKQQYGNLDIQASYITEDGLCLGAFISNLRTAKSAGGYSGYLTKERVRQLNALGMIWDKLDYLWEQNYLACAQYYIQHHNLDIPANYAAPNGLKIGAWVRRIRQMRSGRSKGTLTEDQIQRLDAIGMLWEDAYTRRWEYGYQQAVRWYETHRHLNVPITYVNEAGFSLGKWLSRHREINPRTGKPAIRITSERKAKLDALGMCWEKAPDPWEVRYELAKAFYEKHGHLRIPPEYKPDGIWLNKWLNEQKQIYRGNRAGKSLGREQIEKLEAIGIVWEKQREHAGQTA